MESLGRVVIGSAVGGLLGAAAFLAVEMQPAKSIEKPTFPSFAALSKGSDCKIILDFPAGEFCGKKVDANSVRSWYFGDGTTVGNSNDMLMGQRYDFGIVVNSDKGVEIIPVRFLNPGTAKRFFIQMGAWTGKQSASGAESPFPNWLKIAR